VSGAASIGLRKPKSSLSR